MPRIWHSWIGDKTQEEYSEALSPRIVQGLGMEYAFFSVSEGARHPGLARATYADAMTKQLSLRPVVNSEILLKMGFYSEDQNGS